MRIAESEPEEAEVICLIIARLGLKDTNKRLLFHTERLVDFLLGLLGGSSELGQLLHRRLCDDNAHLPWRQQQPCPARQCMKK